MKVMFSSAVLLGVFAASAQNTVVIIPAFENRFGGPHHTVISIRSDESRRGSSDLIPSRAGAGGTANTGDRRVQRLDPTTVNIPVFPGTTVVTPDAASVTVFPQGSGFAPITNVFGQVIGAAGSSATLPPRTTGTGPATNAVPAPASPPLISPEFNQNLGRPADVPRPAGSPVPGGPGFDLRPGTPTPTAPRTPSASGATDATPAPASPRPTR